MLTPIFLLFFFFFFKQLHFRDSEATRPCGSSGGGHDAVLGVLERGGSFSVRPFAHKLAAFDIAFKFKPLFCELSDFGARASFYRLPLPGPGHTRGSAALIKSLAPSHSSTRNHVQIFPQPIIAAAC